MRRLLAMIAVCLLPGLLPAVELPRFAEAPWNHRVDSAALHPDSAAMIAAWDGLGGFGYGVVQIDFGMHVNHAADDAPVRTLVAIDSTDPNDGYYSPDCEPLGSTLPVPADALIEASSGLGCVGEDCHLLVVQGRTLYELYRANVAGSGTIEGQCLAVWPLDGVYSERLRGDHCTSADAAGLPIAALLFNADEVFAASQVTDGDLGHALRFILPNSRMATEGGEPVYVRPATHAGGPSGPSTSVPYGVRLRLRADFPMAGYNTASQVILRTMQRYGLILADGGNIALTAEADDLTTHSWAELGIDSHAFIDSGGAVLAATDFEVVDTGDRIVETYDCVRETIGSDRIFRDGFEG